MIDGWTHTLPCKDGFYFFRDRDADEQGIALVYGLGAEIMIYPAALDTGHQPYRYVSSAYWTDKETDNPNWEWNGPIEVPR